MYTPPRHESLKLLFFGFCVSAEMETKAVSSNGINSSGGDYASRKGRLSKSNSSEKNNSKERTACVECTERMPGRSTHQDSFDLLSPRAVVNHPALSTSPNIFFLCATETETGSCLKD